MQTEVIDKYWCLVKPMVQPDSKEQLASYISTARLRGDDFVRIFLAECDIDDLEPEIRDIHQMVFKDNGPVKVMGDAAFFRLDRQIFREGTFAHAVSETLLALGDDSAELGVYNKNRRLRVFIGVRNFDFGPASRPLASL